LKMNNSTVHQKKTEVLSEEEDCKIIQVSDENGRYLMTMYQVFPGITFIYSDAHIQSVCFEERKTASNDIFEISHCREGRLECNINGEFCYMSAGDIAIARTNRVSRTSYFPLRHYHGLTIRIDLNCTPECLSQVLEDVEVRPKNIAEKYSCSRIGR